MIKLQLFQQRSYIEEYIKKDAHNISSIQYPKIKDSEVILMAIEQVEAKHFKKGSYIMIDDVPCRVVDNSKSAPGKHGHLKCKIEAIGLIDSKKRMIMKPGDAKIPCPVVDKRLGQIVSISGDSAQLMDMETYEMFETQIPDNLKSAVQEGKEVEYWVIESVKAVMSIK